MIYMWFSFWGKKKLQKRKIIIFFFMFLCSPSPNKKTQKPFGYIKKYIYLCEVVLLLQQTSRNDALLTSPRQRFAGGTAGALKTRREPQHLSHTWALPARNRLRSSSDVLWRTRSRFKSASKRPLREDGPFDAIAAPSLHPPKIPACRGLWRATSADSRLITHSVFSRVAGFSTESFVFSFLPLSFNVLF